MVFAPARRFMLMGLFRGPIFSFSKKSQENRICLVRNKNAGPGFESLLGNFFGFFEKTN